MNFICTSREMNPVLEHETGEDDEVETDQRRREPLVVARQAAEARGPGEVAFDDPASRPIGHFRSKGSATVRCSGIDHLCVGSV